MKTLPPLLSSLLVVLLAVPSAAAPAVQRSQSATRVGYRSFTVTAGRTYAFRAWSDSVDSVLHLWSKSANTEVGFADDTIGYNPRFVFTAGTSQQLFLLARSWSGLVSGGGIVSYCQFSATQPDRCNEASPAGKVPLHPEFWVPLYTGALEGSAVATLTASSGPGISYQTAKVNAQLGGTDDTMLLAVTRTGHLVGFDDDSGVESMSRITPTLNVDHLVLAAYATPGLAHVYGNDLAERDADNDGLGERLEFELGTCDTDLASATSRPYCASRELPLRFDSDRDGLEDSWEVFGLDTTTESIPFPSWGSDPRKKDIFLEQDYAKRGSCAVVTTGDCWNAAVVGNPFTEDMVAEMARVLSDGAEDEWQNLPGAGGGANVHVDLGRTCSVAHAHLCGAWGGGGEEITWVDLGSTPSISVARREVMRSLITVPFGGSTPRPGRVVQAGIDGQNPPGTPPFVPGRSHPYGVIHELGHSLDVQHGGDEPVNCKPNYLSIMAYTSNEFLTGFSHGTRAPLNPARVFENGFGDDATPLSTAATKFWFPLTTPSGSVDFNRSGRFDLPVDGVRAGLTIPGSWVSCAGSTRVRRYVQERPEGTMSPASPDLVEYQGRLWVFRVDGSFIRFQSVFHSGPNGKGGCTIGNGGLGDGSPGEACHDWASAPEGQVFGPADGVTLNGVSALEWDGQLVLTWVEEVPGQPSRLVMQTAAQTFTPGDLIFGTRRVIATNVLPGTEVELSQMFVDTDRFGRSKLLAAFVVEQQSSGPSRYVWYSTSDTASWTRHQVNAPAGWMEARRAPGVTTWPHRSAAVPAPENIGSACGVFGRPRTDDERDDLFFACYRKDTDVFEPVSPVTGGFAHVSRRPSVMFHTLRQAAVQPSLPAEPINGDATYGQFFIEVSMSGDRAIHHPLQLDPDKAPWNSVLMVSRAVRAGEPPTMGTFPLQANGYTWDEWTAPIAATSVAFFENGNLSAMKGVFLTRRKDPDFRERVRGDKLVFLPFVDGTFSATLRDVNDFHLMERGVCLGLKGEAGCGTPHVW